MTTYLTASREHTYREIASNGKACSAIDANGNAESRWICIRLHIRNNALLLSHIPGFTEAPSASFDFLAATAKTVWAVRDLLEMRQGKPHGAKDSQK